MFASFLNRLSGTHSRTAEQAVETSAAPPPQQIPEIFPRRLPVLEDGWQSYRIRTAHGAYLALSNELNPRPVSMPEPDPEQAVILFRSTVRPIIGLLVSPSGQDIDLYGGRLVGPLVPVLIIGGMSGPVSFRSPVEEVHLTAGPLDEALDVGAVAFDRPRIKEWERFKTPSCDFGPLAAGLEHALSEIAILIAEDFTVETFLGRVRVASPEPMRLALPCLLYLAPRDVVVAFAGELVRDRKLTDQVCALLPQDHWSRDGLPGLARWLADRSVASTTFIDEDHDTLDQAFWGNYGVGGAPYPAALLCMAARSTVVPRRHACILATMRNEGIYLLEWIAHHQAIGFEHFFLYSNDNTDESDALLQVLAKHGILTWTKSVVGPNRSPQLKAYGHALSTAAPILDYRWTAIIDLDEFIFLDTSRFVSIRDFLVLNDARQADAIAMSWLVFTPSGQNSWSESGLRHNLRYRLPTYVRETKTIVKTGKFVSSYPHYPIAGVDAVIAYLDTKGNFHYHPGRGEPLATAREPTDENVWVGHYHLKSTDEYLWKMTRTTGFDAYDKASNNFDLRFLSSFVNHHDSAAMQLDTRMATCAPGYDERYRTLMDLDGVRSAHEAVKTSYLAQVEELRARVLAEPATTSDRERLRDIVRSYTTSEAN
jgi:hypothetical protein